MVRAHGYNLPKQMPMIPWLMYGSQGSGNCVVDVFRLEACGLEVP